MGTALAKRVQPPRFDGNPFPFFDAGEFRDGVLSRLASYGDRVGGRIATPPPDRGSGELFRVHLCSVPFPDGPGTGTAAFVAYRAYGRLYLSLTLSHDRRFQRLDGEPGARLYLNDYKFVRSYTADCPPRLEELDEALDALERSRTAVQRRNSLHTASGRASWVGKIRVAVRFPAGAAPEADQAVEEEGPGPGTVLARRRAVIEALNEARKKPASTPVKRKKKEDGESGGSAQHTD